MRLPQHIANFFKNASSLEKMDFEEVIDISITEIKTVSDEFKLALLERNISTIERIASLQDDKIAKLTPHVDINEFECTVNNIFEILYSYISICGDWNACPVTEFSP